MPLSIAKFLDRLRDSEVLTTQEVVEIAGRFPAIKRAQDAQPLVDELVKTGKLTQFQASRLLEGRSRALVLGDYVIERQIGAGGMGEVFLARHRRMKRQVALKVLPPALIANEMAIKRFQREVEAAAHLVHRNIVAAYDAGEEKEIHYLAMEYVPGEDLSRLVKKNGPLAVETALDYVMQAATGLAHAHRRGVIHRDIKPDNLLLDSEGTIKILDMGLARMEGRVLGEVDSGLTKTGSLMGTADFMSPEQALDTKHADARADIYSLGSTLFFLLTGGPMFLGDTYMKRILAHREEPIPSLARARKDAPESLCAVFARMVAKNPDDRYQNMDQVFAALAACRPGGATPSNTPSRAAPLSGAGGISQFDKTMHEAPGTVRAGASPASPSRIAQAKLTTLVESDSGALESPTEAHSSAAHTVQAEQPADWRQKPKSRGSALYFLGAAGAVAAAVIVVAIAFSSSNWLRKPQPIPAPPNGQDDDEQARLAAERDKAEAKALENRRLLAAAKAQLEQLTAQRDQWQQVSRGLATDQLPEIAAQAEDSFQFVRKNVNQVETLTQVTERATTAHEQFEAAIAAVARGRAELEMAKTRATGAWDEARQLLSVMNAEVKEVYQKHPLAPDWQKTARSILADDEQSASRRKYEEAEAAAKKLVLWLKQAPEPVAQIKQLEAQVKGRLDVQIDPPADLYARPKALLKSAQAKLMETDPRPAVEELKLAETLLPQIDAAVQKRPRQGGAVGTGKVFADFNKLLAQGDEALRAGQIAPAQRAYGEAQDLKPILTAPFAAADARSAQVKWAAFMGQNVVETNRLDMKLTFVPPGEFEMGSPNVEIDRQSHEFRHRVTITRPFYLGTHEVTVGQFRKFAEGESYRTQAEKDGKGGFTFDSATGKSKQDPACSWRNPGFTQGENEPVTNVSWNDAVAFCEWLSQKEGKSYGLPTEAQWEYACRAGTESRFSSGNEAEDLARYANCADESLKAKFPQWKTIAARDGFVTTAPVGSFAPNPWGLHDMHGNVWEWCQDWYDQDAYQNSPHEDPPGPTTGSQRVWRGGCWISGGANCRSAHRHRETPEYRFNHLGFRVVMALPGE